MAWLEFRQRFISDFEKTYGRLPTEREVVEAEASFREYARSQGASLEDETASSQPQQTQQQENSP